MTLIPLADSMTSLLSSLKDKLFYDTAPQATIGARSIALLTLIHILQEQAAKDGFRLITINAEPKRVILACNRQGKPKHTTETENDFRKSGRAGTSTKCNCRMRVNINYTMKISAWRITSFEVVHNHDFGDFKFTSETDIETHLKKAEQHPYIISNEMISQAIDKFKSLNMRPEDIAAASLASLAHLHVVSPESPSTISPVENKSNVSNKQVSTNPTLQISTGSVQLPPMSSKLSPLKKLELPSLQSILELQKKDQERQLSPPKAIRSAEPVLFSSPSDSKKKRIIVVRRRANTASSAGPVSASVSPGMTQPRFVFQSSPSEMEAKSPTVFRRMSFTDVPENHPMYQKIVSDALEVDRLSKLRAVSEKLFKLVSVRQDWTDQIMSTLNESVHKYEQDFKQFRMDQLKRGLNMKMQGLQNEFPSKSLTNDKVEVKVTPLEEHDRELKRQRV